MPIGILADTHDNEAAVEAALALFRARGVTRLLHCGDIVSPGTLDLFTGFQVSACLGNNDWLRELEPAFARLGGTIAPKLDLEIDGKRFFVAHGHEAGLLNKAAESGEFDYVLYGHSHQRDDRKAGRTRIVNPGALYRAAKYSVAILAPVAGRLEFLDVPK